MSGSQMLVLIQAMVALDSLSGSSDTELANASRWLLDQQPTMMPVELAERIRDCEPMLVRKVATAAANGQPMSSMDRLRWFSKVIRDLKPRSSTPTVICPKNWDSTKEFDFLQSETREIAATVRELKDHHTPSSWAACKRRIEEIRRYEHRKCKTPCTKVIGVCPALYEPFMPRPNWAYAHRESPEAYEASLRANVRSAREKPSSPPIARRRVNVPAPRGTAPLAGLVEDELNDLAPDGDIDFVHGPFSDADVGGAVSGQRECES